MGSVSMEASWERVPCDLSSTALNPVTGYGSTCTEVSLMSLVEVPFGTGAEMLVIDVDAVIGP